MKNNKNKTKKGFAILFTIVIVSAVSVITAGLTNAIYKQIVLSSLAKDSQIAFYQADTASDCALYADLVEYPKHAALPTEILPNIFSATPPADWSCGNPDISGTKNLSIKFIPETGGLIHYTIEPTKAVADIGGPCFKIDVMKTPDKDNLNNDIYKVVVKARGYNLCDPNNPRTVEREIETDYNQ